MPELTISSEFKKVLHLLKDHYKATSPMMYEFIGASAFQLERHQNTSLPPEWKVFNIHVKTEHSSYLKNYSTIENIQRIFKNDVNKMSSMTIGEVEIKPDYDRFEIIESTIRPVLTDWEEINLGQTKLFQQLSSSSDSLDLQHIGNISRTTLLKLAEIVYNPEKHRPQNEAISVTPDKFKNRLTSYIIAELSGEKNKELRSLAEAAIASVEKSIDLANTVTHKTDVDRTFAEVCVIGTVGAISIIKLIHKQGA
jgi:hypothetical protein